MALNADGLIYQFLKVRYPYPDGNCKIARNEVTMRRQAMEKKIRSKLRALPEDVKKEILIVMIEKENAISEENK